MTPAIVTPPQSVATAALRQVLREQFSRDIRTLDRKPSLYGSSFPLEELTITFEDGGQLDLIFKNVNPRALPDAARRAKPAFLDDPRREIEVYRNVLEGLGVGTAACYGGVIDEGADRYWLFLEKVAGRELYQVGDFTIWRHVARWLAGLHDRFRCPDERRLRGLSRLPRNDGDYYRRWIERATAFSSEEAGDQSTTGLRDLTRIAEWYPHVITELMALSATFIHGEFYASNVIVQGAPPSVRVCPVDWERAALGPGLIDLAALVSGKWTEAQKQALALEYHAELRRRGWEMADPAALLRGLHLCRLHLAVQWLGWSREWSPPPDHRQDWLADAVDCARRLGCAV